MAEPVDLTLDDLRRLDGKLDHVRADLDEVWAGLRSLQHAVDRSIGLIARTWRGGTVLARC